jgi:hypothetical protein
MDLIALIIIIYAVKTAVEDARKAWRKSRSAYMGSAARRFPDAPKGRRAAWAARHDLGYASSQVLQGFPAARHGFASGWHAGQTEKHERRAARERAKAEHLEARARLAPDMADSRARQQAAAEQIRTFTATRPQAGSEGNGEGGTLTSDDPGEAGPEDGRTWSYTSAGNPLAWPSRSEQEARHQARYWSTTGKHQLVHEHRAGGGPGTVIGCYLNGENIQPTPEQAAAWDAAAAETKQQYQQDGRLPPDEGDREQEARQTGQLAITQGETMASGTADITYDGVLQSMTAAKAGAENRAAEQQQASRQASAMSETMQSLEVDPGTLSAMADHLDAHDAAVKAQQQVQETAEAVEASLKRGHAGLNEAHQNAPVSSADKTFYAG